MNDHPRALRDHGRQQRPVDAYSGHQILIERSLPFPIVQARKAACGCARSAENVDDDVDAAEAIQDSVRHSPAPLRCGQIGSDRDNVFGPRFGNRTGRRDDRHAGIAQGLDNGRAHTLRTARDKRPAASQPEVETHETISRDAILSPSRMKK